MKQFVFKVKFSNCADFLKDKIEHGFKYISHIKHEESVILILEKWEG